MSGVSHAQRPPRQRLRSSWVFGNYETIEGQKTISDSFKSTTIKQIITSTLIGQPTLFH
jgi:hypothetical protein